ncbi:hypothetical protein [Thioalkalivibrio nitratireducens]|uniref:hypothetical protein n=1 Tax=Thioalkalivibrio nitratireducens TaxID=186931 RepID=UPI0005C1A1B1|nr:hypothetical protein [Thioalkalivibrio nitratireducens]
MTRDFEPCSHRLLDGHGRAPVAARPNHRVAAKTLECIEPRLATDARSLGHGNGVRATQNCRHGADRMGQKLEQTGGIERVPEQGQRQVEDL